MAPNEMKALIKEEPKESYVLKEIPVPEPKADEILFKVEKVGICGSDIALYSWNAVAQTIATLPFIPGHEAAGVVVKIGSGVKDLPVGSKIAIENHFYCENCYTCEENRGDICSRMDQYGHGRGTTQGGFSEYSIVKAKYCYKLKYGITQNEACLLEPMGVAYNGVDQIQVEGKEVLVIGCGAIGLFAIAVAKAKGATKVIAADVVDSRLELAKKMGATVTINSREKVLKEEVMKLTDGNGIARLVEASGFPPVVNSCFSMLRKGAHLVLIGLPKQPIHIENPLPDVIFKSLTLKTVHGRRIWDTWENCEKLISEKKVDPNIVLSHQFPMSDWKSAFDVLMSGAGCKIIVDPQA